MMRALQVLFVICAGVICAGCSSLAVLRQRLEYRGFLEDWAVEKPGRTWIYVPVLAVLMSCFGSGCNLMEGMNQFDPNSKGPVPFSSAWWERRAEKKKLGEESIYGR
jgi:hypothetical protein